MNVLYRQGIEHPLRTVLIAAVLTLAIAPGLLRLRLRTDGHALVPANDRVVQYDAAIRDPGEGIRPAGGRRKNAAQPGVYRRPDR